jgi:hypothetical protein
MAVGWRSRHDVIEMRRSRAHLEPYRPGLLREEPRASADHPLRLNGDARQSSHVYLQICDLFGGPGLTRTGDLRFRKPLLYPAELRDQVIENTIFFYISERSQ